MKVCSSCNSTKTYITKQGYEHWYHYQDGFVCMNCYSRLVIHPRWNKITNKKWNPINSPRRISYKGKDIHLKENPRKGVCESCGAVKGVDCKKTEIHHFAEYYDDDPLKDTVELCTSCHTTESWRLGQLK